MKTINIKGTDYVSVNERLKEFRTNPKYEGYRLMTEIHSLHDGVCTMCAVIYNKENLPVAIGYAQEKENSSFINKTSYVENCETSAWGRALGNLGIGIDTSIASAEEVLNAVNNQQKPEPKKPTVKENPDADIITGLDAIVDLTNLECYYYENVEKVKDTKAFNAAVNRKKKELQR